MSLRFIQTWRIRGAFVLLPDPERPSNLKNPILLHPYWITFSSTKPYAPSFPTILPFPRECAIFHVCLPFPPFLPTMRLSHKHALDITINPKPCSRPPELTPITPTVRILPRCLHATAHYHDVDDAPKPVSWEANRPACGATNLPAGKVFVLPKEGSANGKIVIDGS